MNQPLPCLAFLLLGVLSGCRTAAPQATSLLGEPLYASDVLPQNRERLEANLNHARRTYEKIPNDEEAIIWYGRRLGYLARYRQAQDVYSKGLQFHRQSYRLLRHRGHRWITLREFQGAVDDLAWAARLTEGVSDVVEQDGAPNVKGIPRSTTRGNITYHLGLALYLLGDFPASVAAYRRCLALARNDDSLVSATYWLYLGLRRQGLDEEARAVLDPISSEMEIIENDVYHQLCVFYKGDQTADQLIATVFRHDAARPFLDRLTAKSASDLKRAKKGTVKWASFGYGYGAWLRLEGREDEGLALFRDVVEAKMWNAFGHIAAEADLAREAGG
jgi:tetratricopeptide (TPR) repeat protein